MEENQDYIDLVNSLDNNEMDQLLLALDTIDPNPHGNDFEVDDREVETYIQDYDQQYLTANRPVHDLSDYPDYSDQIMNDYIMSQLKGDEKPVPQIVDLDTAPNYVDFVNVSIKNMLEFENMFNENTKYEQLRQLLARQ